MVLNGSGRSPYLYTHTGWRKVDGNWLYLHAGGAIGAAGALSGVNVRLPSGLSRYELQLPMEPEAMALAVRASIRLVGYSVIPISPFTLSERP